MRKLLICMPNTLMSNGLKELIISTRDDIEVEIETQPLNFVSVCKMYQPDIFLAEVRNYKPFTLHDWIIILSEIKKTYSTFKVAIILDDDSYPDCTSELIEARVRGEIDAFFYGSCGAKYLCDALVSI